MQTFFVPMEAYRRWCEKNLPDWLGDGRVDRSSRLRS